MNIKKIVLLLLIVALIAIPVMAEETGTEEKKEEAKPQVAAVVNGEDISVNEIDQYSNFNQFLVQLMQNNRDFVTVLLTTEAGKEVINEYRKTKIEGVIIQTLLKQEVEVRKLTLSDEEKEEVFNNQKAYIMNQQGLNEEQFASALKDQGFESIEAYKEYFFKTNEKQILIGKLQEIVLADKTIEEQEVKDYYDDNIDQFKQEARIKASHILLETEEEAKTVLDKVNAGEDFAELAKEYSTGPSAEKGGDLGYLTEQSNFDQAFKEAAFAMELNEVSEPVKSQFGYHIIKITEKQEAKTVTFDEIKDRLQAQLLNNKKQEEWNNFVKGLREKAKDNIEIKL